MQRRAKAPARDRLAAAWALVVALAACGPPEGASGPADGAALAVADALAAGPVEGFERAVAPLLADQEL
ncbi:MAG: hypothetical protein ACK595_09220, partial [Planctomycetota bacterium]